MFRFILNSWLVSSVVFGSSIKRSSTAVQIEPLSISEDFISSDPFDIDQELNKLNQLISKESNNSNESTNEKLEIQTLKTENHAATSIFSIFIFVIVTTLTVVIKLLKKSRVSIQLLSTTTALLQAAVDNHIFQRETLSTNSDINLLDGII